MNRACTLLSLARAGIKELAPESIAVVIYRSTVTGIFDEQSGSELPIIGDEI